MLISELKEQLKSFIYEETEKWNDENGMKALERVNSKTIPDLINQWSQNFTQVNYFFSFM